MPKTNYAHEQRRYRRELLERKLGERRQAEIASLIGVTQAAVSYKIKKSNWQYEELCAIFADDRFSDDEILEIMGRNPKESRESRMCKYIVAKIGEMIAGQSA